MTTPDKEWIASEARKMLHEYGIMTAPYTRAGGDHPMMDFLIRFGKSSFDQGVTQERERCARIAEGSSGPFPKGVLIKADGREATELAIAMQHSLGAGRDAIAAAIRLTPPPSEGERG